jgi:DNA-binding response OmpR family regulator
MNGRPAILIAEDNADILRQTSKILSRNGYAVTMAASLSEARERLPAAQPDLILLDNHLPDGSGLDFLRELRQTAQTPVLLFTAGAVADTRADAIEAGYDGFISKPFIPEELVAGIERILSRASPL